MYILREHYKKKTCPVCGKEFFCYTETWWYKRSPFGQSKVYLCSWTCLNEFDRIRLTQVKPRGRKPKKGEPQP